MRKGGGGKEEVEVEEEERRRRRWSGYVRKGCGGGGEGVMTGNF